MDKFSPPSLSPQDVLLQGVPSSVVAKDDAFAAAVRMLDRLHRQHTGGLNSIGLRSGFISSRRVRPL